MISVTFYDETTGEILSSMTASSSDYILANQRDGLGMMEGLHAPDEVYVQEGQVVDRPLMNLVPDKTSIVANGVDVMTIPLPLQGSFSVRCFGPIRDEWMESSDSIQMSVNLPGDYQLEVTNFPYQMSRVIFHAT